jgi:hypothetical protein
MTKLNLLVRSIQNCALVFAAPAETIIVILAIKFVPFVAF